MPLIKSLTIQRVVEITGGELLNPGENFTVESIRSLDEAGPRDLSFLSNPKYRHLLKSTSAGVVLMSEPLSDADFQIVLVKDPYAALAKILDLVDRPRLPDTGTHPAAVIHESAELGKNVKVAAHAVVGRNAVIGDDTALFPGVVVGDGVKIGSGCILYPNVSIYHDVIIGNRVVIHAGAVIGSDGFGFVREKGAFRKIPQIGTVIIGNDVEIGACTTIDRGSLKDTRIEDGVKLDNLIQIAHNVRIGKYTALAAQVGIAGSAQIGTQVVVGGQVGIGGHVKVGDGSTLAAKTGVTKSLEGNETYAGFPAVSHRAWLREVVNYRRLGQLKDEVLSLKRQLEAVQEHLNEEGEKF